MDNYGFIITRHVKCDKTNKYWNTCVRCIRYFYPDKKIIIIDDNSNQYFIKAFKDYHNIEVIQSEYHGRGELLPYYYFYKKHFFDNALIIHDSIFIHKRINIEQLIGVSVLPLWHFEPDKHHHDTALILTKTLKNNYDIIEKLKFKQNGDKHDFITNTDSEWVGCFGVQSFINFEFLQLLEVKYNIFNLLEHVKTREYRCASERIFGIIFSIEYKQLLKKKSLLGDILRTRKNGEYSYNDYEKDKKQMKLPHYIIKVWTGR